MSATHARRQFDGQSSERLFLMYASARDDVPLRDELIARHRWLARACAAQVRHRAGQLDELEQVALIGVYKAVERFDPNFGVQFRTYASATAFGELRRYFRDFGWSLRVPRRLKDLHVQVQSATHELTNRLGRSPKPVEIADWLSVTVEDVLEAHEAGEALNPQALHAVTDGAPRPRVHELDDAAIAARVDRVDARAALTRMLGSLDPVKREVVALRFFGDLTQQEIADRVGVSQVQVSRLLRAAITEMRNAARQHSASGAAVDDGE